MDYQSRRERLMAQQSVDALWIEDPQNLRYLTGLELSAGGLLLSQKEQLLFVDGRYRERAIKSGLTLHPLSLAELSRHLIGRTLMLGFDSQTTSYHRYEELRQALATATLKAIPSPCCSLRLIKDREEIALIEKSCEIASETMRIATAYLHPGVTEREVALLIERVLSDLGAEGPAFPPIVAFGNHSSMPHYRGGDLALQEGDRVLIDLGAKWRGYCSDLTRTLFLGEPPKELQRCFNLVERALAEAIQLCRPGATVGSLDAHVRSIFREAGLEDKFLHSLGHGLGLDVHEPPRIRTDGHDKDIPLQDGMVLAIEPGLYLEGIGGVRLEETLLVTTSSPKVLTKF